MINAQLGGGDDFVEQTPDEIEVRSQGEDSATPLNLKSQPPLCTMGANILKVTVNSPHVLSSPESHVDSKSPYSKSNPAHFTLTSFSLWGMILKVFC